MSRCQTRHACIGNVQFFLWHGSQNLCPTMSLHYVKDPTQHNTVCSVAFRLDTTLSWNILPPLSICFQAHRWNLNHFLSVYPFLRQKITLDEKSWVNVWFELTGYVFFQALANMLTSAVCTFFFPDHFHLNMFFLTCLLLMCFAVFLYENKNMDWRQTLSDIVHNETLRTRVLLAMLVILGCIVGAFVLSNTNLTEFLPTELRGNLSTKVVSSL